MVGGYKLIDGGGLNLSTTTKQTSALYTKLLEVVEQDKFILLENLVIGTAPVKPIPVTGWKSNTAEITLAGGGYTFVCDASGVTISYAGGGGGGGGDIPIVIIDLGKITVGVNTSSNKVQITSTLYDELDEAMLNGDKLVLLKGIYSYDNDSEQYKPYALVPAVGGMSLSAEAYIFSVGSYILYIDTTYSCWFSS